MQIIKEPNCLRAVDLHGLHVAEALSMLSNALQEFANQGIIDRKYPHAIFTSCTSHHVYKIQV